MYVTGEDATDDSEENQFTLATGIPQHEHLYSDDPKKALKGFYEREGRLLVQLLLYLDCSLLVLSNHVKKLILGSIITVFGLQFACIIQSRKEIDTGTW